MEFVFKHEITDVETGEILGVFDHETPNQFQFQQYSEDGKPRFRERILRFLKNDKGHLRPDGSSEVFVPGEGEYGSRR